MTSIDERETPQEQVPLLAMMMSPDHLEDPYATYRAVRERQPISEIPEMNAWMLTRYDDVKSVFKDDRFGVSFNAFQAMRSGPEVVDEPYYRIGQELLVCNDPPRHSRLRMVFRQPFTPARVEGLADDVRRICDRCLDPIVERGGGDANADFAAVVPLATISALLDVPADDQGQVGQWVYDFAPVLEIGPMTPEQLAAVNAAATGLESYFTRLIAERRETPGEDFITAVLAANDAADEPMTDAEVVNNLSLLYFAGQDTQKYQFTNMLAALARQPEALAWLRADLSRIDAAMNELYRIDTAGQFMGRTAHEDVAVAGVTIREGQTVMVGMGAANRDPAKFPDPDRLVFDRDAQTDMDANITFGAGRHRCIGMHLAQMQLPIMLRAFLERCGDVEVDFAAAVRHPSIATRGYDGLPFRCGPQR